MNKLLPAGYRFRELWMAEQINGLSWPNAVPGGHLITNVGAARRTSANGVHVSGAGTGIISFGAIHNGQAKFAMSLRFYLDQAYAAGSGNQYLFSKFSDGDNYCSCYLATADGKLHLKHRQGAVDLFDISVGTGTLAAGWHQAYFAIGQGAAGGAPSDGARLSLDNGVAATNADATALPGAGVMSIGQYNGGATGLVGIMADVFAMTDDVTAAEETDLYRNTPPLDAVHIWLLDEGTGTTAYDRGTGGNNGTLDTGANGSFSFVKQPVLSLDSINDQGQSASGVNMSDPLSMVCVLKNKLRSPVPTARNQFIWLLQIDASNYLFLANWGATGGQDLIVRANVQGAGAVDTVIASAGWSIDDYQIIVVTFGSGLIKLYRNGSLAATSAPIAGHFSANPATLYVGSTTVPDRRTLNKIMCLATIETAFSATAVRQFSRNLDHYLSLGIGI